MKQKKFKKEAQCCVVSILKKIFDRSPFTCEFVRYFAVVDTDPAFAATSLKSSEWNLKDSRKKVID